MGIQPAGLPAAHPLSLGQRSAVHRGVAAPARELNLHLPEWTRTILVPGRKTATPDISPQEGTNED